MDETVTLHLDGPARTDALGAALAGRLRAGDALLLSGPVGVGKSALARAVIRAAQAAAGEPPEDVPSPTYTLAQTYRAGALSIWHADLYRLGDPGELAELGLEDAFADALCLIEWPDRLGDLRPDEAIAIDLSAADDGAARHLAATGPADRIARLFDGWTEAA